MSLLHCTPVREITFTRYTFCVTQYCRKIFVIYLLGSLYKKIKDINYKFQE